MVERSELLEQHQRRWEAMMAERAQKETDYMLARERRVEECELQLQEMRVQDAEEYNQVKIKLETDVQVLSTSEVAPYGAIFHSNIVPKLSELADVGQVSVVFCSVHTSL